MPVEPYHQRARWCSKTMITEDVLSIKVCHLIDLWPHSNDLIWGIVCLLLLKILLSMWKQSGVPGGIKTKNKPEGHECIPLQGPASRHCFLENTRKWAHLKCWNVWGYTKVEKNIVVVLIFFFLLPAVMVTNCANNLLVLHYKSKFLKMSCSVKWEGFFFSFILLFYHDLISTLMSLNDTFLHGSKCHVDLYFTLADNQLINRPTDNHPANPSKRQYQWKPLWCN